MLHCTQTHFHDPSLTFANCYLVLQWGWKVWHAQHVLGGLYERIYDTMRSRGVPPADETVLWACLARLKDPTTGNVQQPPLLLDS